MLYTDRLRAKRVATAAAAYVTSHLLEGVVEEGTGCRRAPARHHPARGRQDRNDERGEGRLVHRLLAGCDRGRLGRLRRRHAGRSDRREGGAPRLGRLHDARRCRRMEPARSRSLRAWCFATSTVTADCCRARLAANRRRFTRRSSSGPSRWSTCDGQRIDAKSRPRERVLNWFERLFHGR